MLNNPFNNPKLQPLLEGLQYKDLEGMMKPTIHVDEFSAKMGDDADIIVLSFFVRDQQAAKDLMSWFEKGYDFVLDADRSPGEIKPNRYLVYVELRRRSMVPEHIEKLLGDLATLTEFEPSDWLMHVDGQQVPWNEEVFRKLVPLTPNEYRARHDEDLNEVRAQAGIKTKRIHEPTTESLTLQSLAGIR